MTMKCPKCGKDMCCGEVCDQRSGLELFWLPKDFLDKHYLNPYCHTSKTVQENGGLAIKTNHLVQKPTPAYACTGCRLIVVDCGE